MKAANRSVLGLSVMMLSASWSTFAFADHGPVLAVPGHAAAPVMVRGEQATGAIVEGDWGLYRPGHGTVAVSWPEVVIFPPPSGAFYPATGRQPRYGRHEVVPRPARRTAPAESYHRAWSADSEVRSSPPYDPPPVIRAPRLRY